jgi:hypothetical protein
MKNIFSHILILSYAFVTVDSQEAADNAIQEVIFCSIKFNLRDNKSVLYEKRYI